MLLLFSVLLLAVTSSVPANAGRRIPICKPPSPISCFFPSWSVCLFDKALNKDVWYCQNLFTGSLRLPGFGGRLHKSPLDSKPEQESRAVRSDSSVRKGLPKIGIIDVISTKAPMIVDDIRRNGNNNSLITIIGTALKDATTATSDHSNAKHLQKQIFPFFAKQYPYYNAMQAEPSYYPGLVYRNYYN